MNRKKRKETRNRIKLTQESSQKHNAYATTPSFSYTSRRAARGHPGQTHTRVEGMAEGQKRGAARERPEQDVITSDAHHDKQRSRTLSAKTARHEILCGRMRAGSRMLSNSCPDEHTRVRKSLTRGPGGGRIELRRVIHKTSRPLAALLRQGFVPMFVGCAWVLMVNVETQIRYTRFHWMVATCKHRKAFESVSWRGSRRTLAGSLSRCKR